MALPNSRNTTYNPVDPTKTSDLNDIQDQIVALYAEKWRDYGDLRNYDLVAGAAPTYNGTDKTITLASGTQIQYVLPIVQMAPVTKIGFRHRDGATPTGLLRVQPGVADTTGAVTAVTITGLQASTDLAQHTAFDTDEMTFAPTYLGVSEKTLFIDLLNAGVEDVVLHRLLVYRKGV